MPMASVVASTTGLDVLPVHVAEAGVVRLEVRDVRIELLTGIYSEETKLPQPLSISVIADLPAPDRFEPDTPLAASKNYLDLRWAMDEAIPRNVHFTLIEAVAEHICDTLFVQDSRISRIEVRIVKLAISKNGESIGMTLVRHAA
ncbi:dihydroneopterin aldolase [Sphingomonas sp. YR710]|nr:dihydroneopterin aldolase [Sphingomonas sp. YR710]